MKKTSNAIRFETRVPLRDVMKRKLTTIGIEATVAKAAKAMCHDEVGSVIILEHNKPIGYTTNGTTDIVEDSDVVSISLDGPEEIHDEIRGDGAFEKLMKNLDKVTANPYEAVLVASRRARQLNTNRLAQMEMMTEDSEEAIDYRKVTTQAIEDMLRQKIRYHYKA